MSAAALVAVLATIQTSTRADHGAELDVSLVRQARARLVDWTLKSQWLRAWEAHETRPPRILVRSAFRLPREEGPPLFQGDVDFNRIAEWAERRHQLFCESTHAEVSQVVALLGAANVTEVQCVR